MHDDPDADIQAAIEVTKVMGFLGGITLALGLVIGAILWALTHLVRAVVGR